MTQKTQVAPAIAKTPEPPYYAVIFTAQRTDGDRGYGEMAQRMVELAAQQPGFLGVETARGADGFGITVSYWASAEANQVLESAHRTRPGAGRRQAGMVCRLPVRVAKVEREYGKK